LRPLFVGLSGHFTGVSMYKMFPSLGSLGISLNFHVSVGMVSIILHFVPGYRVTALRKCPLTPSN